MPPLNQKGFAHILALFFLVIGLIAGLYLVTHPAIFKPKASGGDYLQIVKDDGSEFPNNTTDNPSVHLKINLPDGWVVNASSQSFNFDLVKPVFAQESCNSDCGSCTTVNTCGYATYDTCTDDKGQTGDNLCSNGATKFGCQAGSNSNCQSGKLEYSCSNSSQCSKTADPVLQTSTNTCSKHNGDCGGCLAESACAYTEGSCIDVNPNDPNVVNCPSGKASYYWANCSTNVCSPQTGQSQPTASPQQSNLHIIQKIIIENKDTDGSSGGLSKQEIPLEKLNTLIPWELEHLQSNQPQAQRYVQVTLSDGTNSLPLVATIILKRDNDGLRPKARTIEFDNDQFLDIANRQNLEDKYLQQLETISPNFYDTTRFIQSSNKPPTETENCLTVGFWVETGFEEFFDPKNNQKYNHESKNTFEEWAKRQIEAWDYIFEESGIKECVGLEKIIRVYDNSLPLNGGVPTNNPDKKDRSVDIIWGFPTSDITNAGGGKHWNRVLNGIDWALLHEMSHARYLIDEYVVNVEDRDKIEVRDPQGDLIVGKYFKKIKWDIVYYNKSQDLMGGGEEPIYAPHQAGAFNRILGQHNAQEFGNFNRPDNFGIYLDDIPEYNILIILDKNKKPIEDARIKIFQSTPPGGGKTTYGEKFIDNTQDLEGTTDYLGRIHVGSNPFGDITDNHSSYQNKKIYPNGNNAVFILEVLYNDHVFYKFIEVGDFNLAYWAGNIQEATYEVITDF